MRYLKIYILIFSILFITACSSKTNPYYDKSKPHHTKEGFKNIHVEDSVKKSDLFSFFKMRVMADGYWADHKALKDQVKVVDVNIKLIHENSIKPRFTWLGHSSFLIQYKNINILTDPVFSDTISPLGFGEPMRYTRAPMDFAKLPKIDLVLISHNHYDHLDKDTIKTLSSQESSTIFYIPLGLKDLLKDYGIEEKNIKEMDWLDKDFLVIDEKSLSIKAYPSQHYSSRSLRDSFQSLWASWFLRIEDFNFWFAGDTGYNDTQFKEIGKDIDKLDLVLIPIGGYEPRWFMKQYNINPREAIYIHKDLKAKKSIAMHWGTYPLSAEEPNAPVIELNKQIKEQGIGEDEFIVLDIGESLELE